MNWVNPSEKLSTQLPKEIVKHIEKIRLDNTSGAAELAKQAAKTLTFLVDKVTVSSPLQVAKLIENTTTALVEAQPAMAPIFNLANKTLLEIDNIDIEEEIRQTVRKKCQNFIKQLEKADQAISELATDLIKDNSTIITHSYSNTVLKAFLQAKREGKIFDIICTESRPMNEGMYLAERLGRKGIKVKLVVDSAVYSFLPDAQMVFVGADALSTQGLVNKIGTSGLALAARKFKTDFYTLCSLEKILPAGYKIELRTMKNPKEILSKPLENVIPINLYFDLTPLTYLTGIVTEKDIMTLTKMKQHMKSLKIHRAFSN